MQITQYKSKGEQPKAVARFLKDEETILVSVGLFIMIGMGAIPCDNPNYIEVTETIEVKDGRVFYETGPKDGVELRQVIDVALNKIIFEGITALAKKVKQDKQPSIITSLNKNVH